ncbi:phosphomethylpyrimidine synthase ThiC [Candidatus Margulisiibacteriota bacterium]
MTLKKDLRKGKTSLLLEKIAKLENVSLGHLVSGIKSGKIVVPYNKIHNPSLPIAIGEGLRTKVNANIGTSKEFNDLKHEIDKVEVCLRNKADAIMDLSVGGDLDKTRKAIINASTVPVGTVPIYQAAIEAGSILNMTSSVMFRVIEKHAKSGVDFMTVHCGVTRALADRMRKKDRVAGIVSRGGAFLFSWMSAREKENPLYEQYDRLLDIAAKYDVTISLGDGMRPGAIADAGDEFQIGELEILGELAARADKAGVQVMIEGPGHVPLDKIEEQMRMEKEICNGAPFYVLGPLPTDIAPGYDHLTSAIGGSIAAAAGADFLCYVTPSEHLGLPNLADVKDGIIAARIAGHVGDLVKGIKGAKEWDLEMSKARRLLDWDTQLDLAIDPVTAGNIRAMRSTKNSTDTCTMCGEFCALKVISESKKPIISGSPAKSVLSQRKAPKKRRTKRK